MKACPSCQFLNEDDNIICVHCEQPFPQNAPKAPQHQSPTAMPQHQSTPALKKQPPKAKNIKPLIIAVCFVVFAIAIVGFISFSGNSTKNDNSTTTYQAPSLSAESTKQSAESTTAHTTDKTVNDDYIFPSDEKYLTYDILSNYAEEEIGYLCNEMYARHGYIFTKEKYREYFSEKSWYNPRHSSMEYVVTLFNKIEQANLQTITDYREYMSRQTHTTDKTVNDDYIFPSDEKYLTYDILSNYTEEEIGYLCNEMYARHGYIFTKEKYREYFSEKSWYNPRHSSMEYVVTLFNKIEQANLQTITDYREYMSRQ